METKIINGRAIAREIKNEVKKEVEMLKKVGNGVSLNVIMVGEDPASETYVKQKEKACEELGIKCHTYKYSEGITEEYLLFVIGTLNNVDCIDGILVQLPLPKHISTDSVVQEISQYKDVDGLNIQNIGKLTKGGEDGFIPCTPSGIMELLKRSNIEIEGKHCVVIGRSNLVGKPISLLLQEANGTVTMCHSKTQDLEKYCKMADILVVAAGKPHLINGSMIKEGAVVIDVGIHRTENGLCGDVDTESCVGIASAITPVPGGVGPVTVAMLMKNCVKAHIKLDKYRRMF
jgi:methylenetetrahydrofolate dehydrogenase (NADP+)/methenyltetrahydrofolate cyclohydrolase